MTSPATSWAPPAAHTTPTEPYQAAYTGRPPGTEPAGGWGADEAGLGGLGNSSLVVDDAAANFSLLDAPPPSENKTHWATTAVMHMGVEVELFPDWLVGVWTGVLVTLMVVGVGGNVLVPVVVVRTRDLRSSTNFLLVNLAAADLLVLLVSLPTALVELHSRPETWVLGEPMCKLVPFVEYCVSHASVLTILVISFERYYAICRPLRASYTCTKMRACTCILSIWAAAVLLSSPMLVMSKYLFVPYADGTMVHGCYTELTSFWSCLYINVVTAVFFFVPLVLLVLLYLVIGRSLMRDSASAALQHRKIDLPNMKARKQVVVMLATVTIFFFVSLFPFRVLTLWIVWTPQETIETIGPLRYFSFLYGTRVLFFANSAVNPILYNLTSTKFREAFLKLLGEDRGLARRHLSRQSTFNTTGTSMSNGRSGSSRTIPTDLVTIKDCHPARVVLGRCGRQISTDDFSTSRPSIARYGRQSSFAGSYCFTSPNSASNSASCSRQNSRMGDHCAYGAEEVGKRPVEGEKRHSGEGRRLLEAERTNAFTDDMIEEERSSGATVRGDSLRRSHEKKIESEMEQLLAEGAAGSPKELGHTSATSCSISSPEPRPQCSNNEIKVSAETEPPEESALPPKENEGADVISTGESGKSVQFSDE